MATTFPSFVSTVFQSWTTLRLAEQNSTGGQNTKSKIENLTPLVLQQVTKRTEEEDLADFLEEYLCKQLDIVCEDDSQFSVAKLIVDGYALAAAGKLTELAALGGQIPSGCPLTQCITQTIDCEVDGEDVSDEEYFSNSEFSDEPMDDE